MTQALGVSRAQLYRLFKADGGVRRYDQNRRFGLLHQALIEAPHDTPIGVLGARFGFFDLSALSRLFRRRYGHSMSAVRAHLGAVSAVPVEAPPLRRFRDAFEGLSSPPPAPPTSTIVSPPALGATCAQ